MNAIIKQMYLFALSLMIIKDHLGSYMNLAAWKKGGP
jgi:hypothetical protein